ncbi:MAG: hypothetical protein PHY48_14835 [Candidatus Cloacimonetes bacterium]|nr:hypothetical protein [Candidatus Cloacimonadota bacterium]
MKNTHDRYINTKMLECISRPQYENGCSIASLTAVFNYLYADQLGGIKSPLELASIMGLNINDIGSKLNAGNNTVMGWFDRLTKHYKLRGNCSIYLSAKDVKDYSHNSLVISKFKDDIARDDHAFIYHLENHYNVVLGYFEHSVSPAKPYDTSAEIQRWIVLGEHSEYNPIKDWMRTAVSLVNEDLANKIQDKMTGPIWSRRWRSIRHDLMKSSNHCIMVFSR